MTPLPDSLLRRPIAHRAYHALAAGRPENSRAAIRAAIAAGYGIEIDIQPSSDGRAMVFHDYDLKRLTGVAGKTAQTSASQLAKLSLQNIETGIPTLVEVLALVAGKVPLLIEIKDQDGALGPHVGALERSVAQDLRGYAGPVALMSFNPHSVAALAQAAPHLPRGLTTCAFTPDDWPQVAAARRHQLRAMPDLEPLGASFISHDATDLDAPAVAVAKARGLSILCWTIRSTKAEAQARRIAHNITFEGYVPQPLAA